MSDPLRVAIVDDHPFIIKVLGDSLRAAADMDLVATYETAREALDGLPATGAELVVVDQNLRDRDLSGTDLIAQLREQGSQARFLMFSAEQDTDLAEKARAAGAVGLLSKMNSATELVESIRRAGRDG